MKRQGSELPKYLEFKRLFLLITHRRGEGLLQMKPRYEGPGFNPQNRGRKTFGRIEKEGNFNNYVSDGEPFRDSVQTTTQNLFIAKCEHCN